MLFKVNWFCLWLQWQKQTSRSYDQLTLKYIILTINHCNKKKKLFINYKCKIILAVLFVTVWKNWNRNKCILMWFVFVNYKQFIVVSTKLFMSYMPFILEFDLFAFNWNFVWLILVWLLFFNDICWYLPLSPPNSDDCCKKL